MRKFLSMLCISFLSLLLVTACSSSGSTNDSHRIAPASENTANTSTVNTTATASPNNDTLNEQTVNAALKAAEAYKNKEYNVIASEDILSTESLQTRNEEMTPFFTEYFKEKAVDTRYTALPLQIANKQQLSLKPENLQFSVMDHRDTIVDLRYKVDLVLIGPDGKEQNRVPLEGVLTLFDVNGQWLLQGDRFDSAAFQKLIV
ncbi:hypothetical protein J7E73_26240 [Paenibacillus albidus]|uniref:hypothetical protein n=1 Tax=Paenibacillus albidus TaxID=2041023 RepID=UPI001BECD0ED|nr:hypothetical protein [Paenibacillus albidus]MBT2292572.1 hypothetical protein [Paenibacillus albidus]